jgi:hypothetical protein
MARSKSKSIVAGAVFCDATNLSRRARLFALSGLAAGRRDDAHPAYTFDGQIGRFIARFAELDKLRHRASAEHRRRVCAAPINLLTIKAFSEEPGFEPTVALPIPSRQDANRVARGIA